MVEQGVIDPPYGLDFFSEQAAWLVTGVEQNKRGRCPLSNDTSFAQPRGIVSEIRAIVFWGNFESLRFDENFSPSVQNWGLLNIDLDRVNPKDFSNI